MKNASCNYARGVTRGVNGYNYQQAKKKRYVRSVQMTDAKLVDTGREDKNRGDVVIG